MTKSLEKGFAALGLSLTDWQQTLQAASEGGDSKEGPTKKQASKNNCTGENDDSETPATQCVVGRSSERLPTLWVGLSGGLDSCVLLNLLHKFFSVYGRLLPFRLCAIHVNHQLQAKATGWAQWCQALCAEYGIPIVVEAVAVDPQVQAQRGLEFAARQARYAAFRGHVQSRDLIALAHHADDQLETILLRWLRGAGIDGLAGMSERSNLAGLQLWRPLLNVPRHFIEQLAQQWGLSWQEDPSNTASVFDRNYLRHEVIPRLKTRWPGVLKTVARTGEQAQQASEDVAALADRLLDLAHLGEDDRDDLPNRLPVSVLQGLPHNTQVTLIRRWLIRAGCGELTTRHVHEILNTVVNARVDAQPKFMAMGWQIRRNNHCLYVNQGVQSKAEGPVSVVAPLLWCPCATPHVPWANGMLSCAMPSAIDKVLRAFCCHIGIPPGSPRAVELTVVPRSAAKPGELPKRLKQRFQASGVPAWQRTDWPILYLDTVLLCVPGLWVHKMLDRVLDEGMDGMHCAAATLSEIRGIHLFQWLPD